MITAVMRTKEFDRETALREAVKVFSDHSYEGTATEELLRGMGISRQSMYDTFGDKRQLYLEALQYYAAHRVADQIRALNTKASPSKGIEAVLQTFVDEAAGERRPGCMGIGAVCEFGRADQEIALLLDTADRTLLAALERRLHEAKAADELGRDVSPRAAAEFLQAILIGLQVGVRGGASPNTLRNIARIALRSLK
jgi:AcrR family transcriptional regulator